MASKRYSALRSAVVYSHIALVAPIVWVNSAPTVGLAAPIVLPKPPAAMPVREIFQPPVTRARLTRSHRRGNVEPVIVPPARQVKYMHASARRRLMARLAEAA